MSIKVAWDNQEHSIVRYVFDEKWTWDDFDKAKNRAVGMVTSVSHPVVTIVDTHPRMIVPHDMLINARNGLLNRQKNTALIIVVLTNPFLITMLTNLKTISPHATSDIVLTDTLDEAREIAIRRLREVGAESDR